MAFRTSHAKNCSVFKRFKPSIVFFFQRPEIVGQGMAAPLVRSGERLTDNNNNATDGHDDEGGRW